MVFPSPLEIGYTGKKSTFVCVREGGGVLVRVFGGDAIKGGNDAWPYLTVVQYTAGLDFLMLSPASPFSAGVFVI